MNNLQSRVDRGVREIANLTRDLSLGYSNISSLQNTIALAQTSLCSRQVNLDEAAQVMLNNPLEILLQSARQLEKRNTNYLQGALSQKVIEQDQKVIEIYQQACMDGYTRIVQALESEYELASSRQSMSSTITAGVFGTYNGENQGIAYLSVLYDRQHEDILPASLGRSFREAILKEHLRSNEIIIGKVENIDGLLMIPIISGYKELFAQLKEVQPAEFSEANVKYIVVDDSNALRTDVIDINPKLNTKIKNSEESGINTIKKFKPIPILAVEGPKESGTLIPNSPAGYINITDTPAITGRNSPFLYNSGVLDYKGGSVKTKLIERQRFVERKSLEDYMVSKHSDFKVLKVEELLPFMENYLISSGQPALRNLEAYRKVIRRKKREGHLNILGSGEVSNVEAYRMMVNYGAHRQLKIWEGKNSASLQEIERVTKYDSNQVSQLIKLGKLDLCSVHGSMEIDMSSLRSFIKNHDWSCKGTWVKNSYHTKSGEGNQ